jgi:DNA-binding NarL/FixJ family response regulator
MNTISPVQDEYSSLPKIYGNTKHAQAVAYSPPPMSAEHETRVQRMKLELAALQLQETRLKVGASASAAMHQEWSQIATVICQSLELVLNHIKNQPSTPSLHTASQSQSKFYLNPNQIRLIRMIVKGLSNKEISEELNLKQSSINQALSRVYKILNVSSRMQAVAKCVQEGII